MAEADSLEPHLRVLNAGKGSQKDGEEEHSLSALKKRRVTPAAVVPTEPNIRAAAAALHAWLTAPKSALRGMLQVLGGGGAFFAGFAAEKVARAWVEESAATARLSKEF